MFSASRATPDSTAAVRPQRPQRRVAMGRASSPHEAQAHQAATAALRGQRPKVTGGLRDGAALSVLLPESAHALLQSPGTPLEGSTRCTMEVRFGADFSQVRIHRDERAARSSRELGARAYTHGQQVVFGAGQWAPHTAPGRELIAHELAHTLQQRGSATPLVQRACLSAKECEEPAATLENFVADTVKRPENISKADKRKAACAKTPPDAACTSDGHGATATSLTEIVRANYPSRLGVVAGIFVDKDMPDQWAAVTRGCANFMPPKAGERCTFVPDVLEAQAKLYQGGAKTVGAHKRQDWLAGTLGTLTHETEHARFNAQPGMVAPGAGTCKFADHKRNLSEMAAHLSEMHVFYRAALARPEKGRYDAFFQHFNFWVKNGSEDIAGIVKDLRCKCECADADHYITRTVASVSDSQKWNTHERQLIHSELRDPKWALKWPVTPPDAMEVHDIPDEKAQPLRLE